jgi:hypothetical protein
METMTDYKKWTQWALLVSEPTDVYWLFDSVANLESGFLFTSVATPNGGVVVTSGDGRGDKLFLTERSRAAMLQYLQDELMDGMDPESYYGFARAMMTD